MQHFTGLVPVTSTAGGAQRAAAAVASRNAVARHLGLPADWAPRADLGETATDFQVWSPAELDVLYERTGGTVALQPTGRTVAVTLTISVPGVGPVAVLTEWDAAAHPEHIRLPVLQAAAAGRSSQVPRGAVGKAPAAAHGWGPDDNKPVIPRIPRPRPSTGRAGQ